MESKWVDCFARTFELSGVGSGDLVAILSESQSRPDLVGLTEAGLFRCGAKAVHIKVPSPRVSDPVPVRSTGASQAFAGYDDLLAGLSACTLAIDVTVEGLLHSEQRDVLLKSGVRVFMISSEHPEILARCMPNPDLLPVLDDAMNRLSVAKTMSVKSRAGTDLHIKTEGAPTRGGVGFLRDEDMVAYWPAGLVLCFPLENSVDGTLVLNAGDVNLTFKKYVDSPVTMHIEKDNVVAIEGTGRDAVMLRSYYEAWNDPNAYNVSHVGWGLNPAASWESLTMYDKNDINGTELRAIAGSFLFSTGANEFANRLTNCHFDFPMRHCDVLVDDVPVVEDGHLAPLK